MNPLDKIQNSFEDFTKNENEIAIYIINNPKDIARSSINEMANLTSTSKSAIIRFTQKLGYAGYSEFKYDLSRSLVSYNAEISSESIVDKSSLISIIQNYIEHLQMMMNMVDEKDLEIVAKKILSSRRLKILGVNRTFNSAIQFRQRLSKVGIDAEASGDQILINEICSNLDERDLCIIFTSQNNCKYENTISQLSDNNCPCIIFTMINNTFFKKNCFKVIQLPNISKVSNVSFLDDQAIFFVFIEVLLNVLATYATI